MAFLKQILVTLVVLVIGGIAWLKLDPDAGRTVLESGFDIPAPVREAVLMLAPGSEAPANTGTRKDQAGQAGAPSPGAPRGGRGPILVTAAPAATSSTSNRMRALGTGEAQRSVAVYPDATGIIEQVPFKSGDRVEVGAVLAKLESANEEVALARARIALDAADERLERVQRLQASNAITAVEVRDNLRLRDTARLDLRSAEIALAKRQIVAPIAGYVGIVEVDTGDLVGNTSLIATIDDRSRVKVIFFTPEEFVRSLTIGQPVEARSTALPGRLYAGTITALDSRIDPASRTLRTEALVDNPQDELRPGMSFDISIETEGERFLAVDPLAVVWERAGPMVWTVVDGKAAKARVRIVERNIDSVLVASDELRENDLVVVEGVQSVREGAAVEVEPAPGVPAEPDDPVAPPSASSGPATIGAGRASAVPAEGPTLAQAAPGAAR